MGGASLPYFIIGGILLMEFVLKKPIKTMQFTDVKKVDELAEFLKQIGWTSIQWMSILCLCLKNVWEISDTK